MLINLINEKHFVDVLTNSSIGSDTDVDGVGVSCITHISYPA